MPPPPDTASVVRTELGYYRIDPVPREEELRGYYARKYYSEIKPEMYRQDCPEEMRMIHRICRWAADKLLELRPKALARGFLDIGCGPGYLMAEMQRRSLPVSGMDPDPGACARYNSQVSQSVVKGFCQDLSADQSGARYDWINLSNVIEHVPDPVGALRAVRRKLPPGGVLRVAVPNDFSLFQNAALESGRVRRKFWVCPPDHLNYFSPESLEKTLQTGGFDILSGHADFPMELFLLAGRDYSEDPALGRQCHLERLRFEDALPEMELRKIYEGFYRLGIGRSLVCYARPSE